MENKMDNRIKLLNEELSDESTGYINPIRPTIRINNKDIKNCFYIVIKDNDIEPILHKHGFCLGDLIEDGVFFCVDIEEAYKNKTYNKYSDIEKIYKNYIRPKKIKEIFPSAK